MDPEQDQTESAINAQVHYQTGYWDGYAACNRKWTNYAALYLVIFAAVIFFTSFEIVKKVVPNV